MIVQRATKALETSKNPQEFSDTVRGIQKEEFGNMLNQLPEDMRHNPKCFYKVVKAVGDVNRAGVLVDEIIINQHQPDEHTVPMTTGLTEIITETYCGSLGNTVIDKTSIGNLLRQQAGDHQWSISNEEMKTAIHQLSWKKALGSDGMHDTFFHEMIKQDNE